MVKIVVRECRMRFGEALKYDHSGEKNLTRGIPPQSNPAIAFDKNGQPRFLARRNHPRILQQPYLFPWYGANNDTQIFLINSTGPETLEEIGPEQYEKMTCNLVAAGVGGLEHHNGLFITEEYVTKYSCKGSENSANWDSNIQTITDQYCDREDTQKRNVRSLVGKHMSTISGGMSTPRDHSLFTLGGGMLKRNSVGTPFKCSVSSVDIDSFGTEGTNEEKKVSMAQYNKEVYSTSC